MKEKGQTLIEALVALGAAVLVLSAISVAVISALNNVQYTKNQNQATQYAQQGVETLRQMSQSSWGLFSGYSGKYCLAQDETLPCPAGTNIGSCADTAGLVICNQNYGIFVREMDIEQSNISKCSGNALTTVTVSWSDSKCTDSTKPYCHNVKLNSCLANHASNFIVP